ncbi:MAG: hypothetical protein LC772_00185 [Chloroflexi bacterium]|nr:hypothetical protein [Chloroflexota bacterium]
MAQLKQSVRAAALAAVLVGVLLSAALLPGSPARAGVLLQGFYWDVPSPAAGNAAAPWWWDHLAAQSAMLRDAGFTAIWIPPVLKGNSGGYSVGYDPFDDYDLGSKLQKGTIPLRYGTREQLERCVAMLRANGLDVYVDLVENHRDGDDGHYDFIYRDAYGVDGGGRFPKGPLDFHPVVPQDPGVPDDGHELSFGRDLAPINGVAHRAFDGLINSGSWLTRALDVQGYRLDDVKGISTLWLRPFLNTGAMNGKFAVGEFWDENRERVENWVQGSMGGRASAFDFPLRTLLKQMCDDHGYFDMRKLDHAGLTGIDPRHSVTFVENHDTARGSAITRDKALAYAYILTSDGYPSIFYKDYSTDAGCAGMKPTLDPLIRIHETLAKGPTVVRWKDRDAFVFERTGGQRLLVGLNDNERDAQTVTVQTGFGAGQTLHDYAGHGPDLHTAGPSGRVTVTIPPDRDGHGYVCYSRLRPPSRRSTARIAAQQRPCWRVTQEYAGARDLDIKPADHTAAVTVCRVWAAAGTPLRGNLRFDHSGWSRATTIRLDLEGPTGKQAASRTFSLSAGQGSGIGITAASTGWYIFRISSHNTPSKNRDPAYWLDVNYQAGP